MQTVLISAISSIIGAILVGLFSWLASKEDSEAAERNNFATNLINRVNAIELRQEELEREVTIWKMRYWSLYKWLIQISQTMNINLPEYHKMDLEQLEEFFHKQNHHEEDD